MNAAGELPSSLEVLPWQAVLEVKSTCCNKNHQISDIYSGVLAYAIGKVDGNM